MIEIKILDNHKIPRKYRKEGYRFYTVDIRGEKLSCDGAGWYSKNTYVDIMASKKDLTKIDYYKLSREEKTRVFIILKSLVVRIKTPKDGLEQTSVPKN